MFCSNCGNELPDGRLFCTSCGKKTEVKKPTSAEEVGDVLYASHETPMIDKPEQVKHSEPSPNKPPPITSPSLQLQSTQQSLLRLWGKLNKQYEYLGVALVSVVLIILVLFSTSGGRAINSVKSGTFNGYPEQTVGEAFENFFGDPEWKAYKEDGDTYVKFSGTCLLGDEDANTKIIFLVDGKNFSVERLNVGNTGEYTTDNLNLLLDAIYSE